MVYFDAESESEDGLVQVEVAMQATQGVQGSVHAFANNINTREGGTHMTGFKTALTRVVNDYATSHGLLKDIEGTLKGEDIREGLTAVISIKHPDPQFEGQTKTKLGNSEVRGIVESAMHEGLSTYFEEHPDTAEAVISKAVQAAKARMAPSSWALTTTTVCSGRRFLSASASAIEPAAGQPAESTVSKGRMAAASQRPGRAAAMSACSHSAAPDTEGSRSRPWASPAVMPADRQQPVPW